jgi:hypothetical protein
MSYEPIFDRLTDTDIERWSGEPYPRPHEWDPEMERCSRCGVTKEQLAGQVDREGCHG